MALHPSEFDPRKFFGETVKGMRAVCIVRYEAFGTAGNASQIKPISLENMFQRYAKGELNAKVNRSPAFIALNEKPAAMRAFCVLRAWRQAAAGG